jgi:hypothetical protein
MSGQEISFRTDDAPDLIGVATLLLWLGSERLLQLLGFHQPNAPAISACSLDSPSALAALADSRVRLPRAYRLSSTAYTSKKLRSKDGFLKSIGVIG